MHTIWADIGSCSGYSFALELVRRIRKDMGADQWVPVGFISRFGSDLTSPLADGGYLSLGNEVFALNLTFGCLLGADWKITCDFR
jgi:hypothetical protein